MWIVHHPLHPKDVLGGEHCVSILFLSLWVWVALLWKGVLSRVGPTLHPGLLGQGSATHDPELERVRKKKIIFFFMLNSRNISGSLFISLVMFL